MRNSLRWLSGTLALGLVTAFFYGCGTNSGTTPPTNYSYQGLGSKWTAAFTGSNFTITYDATADGTVEMTVNGTFVEYANKFRKLTVVSATGTGPGGTPSAGNTAFGLEIPGYAFFLKPLGGNSEPIVMVNAGACPSADFTSNWMMAKFQDSTVTPKDDSDAFGQAVFSVAGKTAAISRVRFDNTSALSGSSITLTSCTGGTQGFDDGGSGGTMYVTATGGLLVNPGNGIIFASPVEAADPTATDWGHTYSGLVFNANSSEKVFPAKVVLSGTTGTGTKITDVETDALDSSSVNFAALTANAGKKGIFNGTVDGRPLNCVTSSPGGQRILACNGAAGAATGGVYPTFFFLGVAR